MTKTAPTDIHTGTIAVFGAGSWGTAIAIHLAKLHPHVILWGRDADQIANMEATRLNQRYLPSAPFPSNLQLTADLSCAVAQASMAFIVVPSHAFADFLQAIKPFAPAHLLWVWATKGIQPSGQFLHEIFEQIMGSSVPKGLVAGPSFAGEIAAGLPTAITVAANQPACALAIAEALSGPRCRVYITDDLIGAQLGGAVKNVLAIATGCSDGLGFGANARSALITRGLAELMRLGLVLGAKRDTLMGLAGLGDLVLTCTDDKSRNRRFGLALGRGETVQNAINNIGQVVEGATAAAYVYRLAQRHGVEMPITEQVYRLLQNEYPVAETVEKLFSRELGRE